MVMDISMKLDFLRALTVTKNINQLKGEFPRLTELEIRTVIKQLKDEQLIIIVPLAPDPNSNNEMKIEDTYIISGNLDEITQRLIKKGMQSKTQGTVRQVKTQ